MNNLINIIKHTIQDEPIFSWILIEYIYGKLKCNNVVKLKKTILK